MEEFNLALGPIVSCYSLSSVSFLGYTAMGTNPIWGVATPVLGLWNKYIRMYSQMSTLADYS